jgi:hypothetical protein
MTYSVIWRLTTIQQLGQIAAAADDPAAVQRAAAYMDYLLRRMPRDLGESRSRGFRLWYDDVLGLFYHIDEDAMQVEVILVGPARRH